MLFQQLMPLEYSLNPELTQFIVAKIKKENTERQLKIYKSRYPDYFKEHEYLKLVKFDKASNCTLMLFCKP